MKKSQTWITDVMLATGFFLMAFIAFFYFINISTDNDKATILKDEGEKISLELISGSENESLTFIIDNKINKNKLIQVSKMNYLELKKVLGVSYDFCIYFEDEDGNLINLSQVTGKPYAGIGSPKANLNGAPCGE